MKILHLSDTHGCHHSLYNLPEADVLVHSGDFTMTGSDSEVLHFLNWLCDLPYKHKIFHTHSQHGIQTIDGTVYSNGAIMNDDYTLLNEPNIIEV